MRSFVRREGRCVEIIHISATPHQIAAYFQLAEVFIEGRAADSDGNACVFGGQCKLIAVSVRRKEQIKLQSIRRECFVCGHPFVIVNHEKIIGAIVLVNLNPFLIGACNRHSK